MRGRGRSRWLGLGMVGLLACESGSRRLADGGADAAARVSPALASRVGAAPAVVDAGVIPAAAAPAPAPPAETDADADADFRGAITGRNVTAAYHEKYARAAPALFAGRRQPLSHKYRVILVPGFLTRLYMQLSEVAKDTFKQDGFLDYLSAQKEALQDLGFTDPQELLEKEEFDTIASVATNGERIARAVQQARAGGRKVILISHSKGGNDTLAALLLLQKRRALGGVAGWISLQSGFFGSPVADEAMQRPVVQKVGQVLLEGAGGGSLDSLRDSTSQACQQFMATHEKEIRQLVRAVPILSFLSWKPRPREPQLLHPDTLLVATRDRMEAQGLKNDGLIPRKNALLPGTEYVALAYIDHAEPAMNEPAPVIPSKLDRKKLTWALLAMLLERLEPRGAATRASGGGARP